MEKENKQNHFNNPVVSILLVALIGLGGYVIFSKNQNGNQPAQENQVSQQTTNNSGIVTQNKPEEQSINAQQSELDNLKKEVENLKNQKPQVIVKEAPKEILKFGADLTSIISQWRPRIAYINCNFRNVMTQAGSGFFISTDIGVITNEHVVSTIIDGQRYDPDYCTIKLPDDNVVVTSKTFYSNQHNQDVVGLGMDNPSEYMKKLNTRAQACYKGYKEPTAVGDEVVILGYPAIGSQTDITATEGIISGIDWPYYVTSAKIEHGNSGGVAILVKNNCNLGIPTAAVAGSIESLGRILDLTTALRSLFP